MKVIENYFLFLFFFKNLPSFHSLLIKLSLNKQTRTILPLPKTDEFYHNWSTKNTYRKIDNNRLLLRESTFLGHNHLLGNYYLL